MFKVLVEAVDVVSVLRPSFGVWEYEVLRRRKLFLGVHLVLTIKAPELLTGVERNL